MAAIRRLTEIPGPRSRAWLARRDRVVARGLSRLTPVVVARGDGALIVDLDGNRFVDFAGGLGALNVGHHDADVTAAVTGQAEAFLHACFPVSSYPGYIVLAERLAALAPGDFAKKVLLVNSGAEAVENAVKIARHATGRPDVVCFDGAFHGRTLYSLGMTSKVVPYKEGFGPFPPGIHRVPYAYCYRCPVDATYPSCQLACVQAAEDALHAALASGRVAAVVVEPVLGEGGFVVPPPGYLSALADLCRRHGVLLIADEVQTGFGRTGRMFACERDAVAPDLLVVAKSLAAGLPLGAVVGRADVMDHPAPGGLGSTFGGNPVACAAALAVLERLEAGPLLARSEAIGARIEAEARRWQAVYPAVGDIRRAGAMVGVELVSDRTTRRPAPDAARDLVRRSCERGVILMTTGTWDNVVRFLTPLTIADEELDEGLAVLGQCVAEQAEAAARSRERREPSAP